MQTVYNVPGVPTQNVLDQHNHVQILTEQGTYDVCGNQVPVQNNIIATTAMNEDIVHSLGSTNIHSRTDTTHIGTRNRNRRRRQQNINQHTFQNTNQNTIQNTKRTTRQDITNTVNRKHATKPVPRPSPVVHVSEMQIPSILCIRIHV